MAYELTSMFLDFIDSHSSSARLNKHRGPLWGESKSTRGFREQIVQFSPFTEEDTEPEEDTG